MKITYKFFCTKKTIPWMLGGENIKPQPSINDGFFDFTEIKGKQFNFDSVFSATIVVDSDKYTYWKVDRYIDDRYDKSFYFYTHRVISILKNAYMLDLSLDIYLTYTRHIIEKLKNSSKAIKVNRGTITNPMLDFPRNESEGLYKALANVDNIVADGDDGYIEAKPYPIVDYSSTKSTSLFPISSGGQTFFGINVPTLSQASGLIPLGANGSIQTNNVYSVNSNQTLTNVKTIKDNNKWGMIDSDVFHEYYVKPSDASQSKNVEKMTKLLNEAYQIDSFIKPNDLGLWEKVNLNVASGYFAVFRHAKGYIDAYPIIGDVEVLMKMPISTTWNGHSVNSNYNVDFYITNNVFRYKLQNTWESIYEEFLKNNRIWYGKDGFVGIYKWVFPSGKLGKMHLSLLEHKYNENLWTPQINQFDFSWNGQTKRGYVQVPYRIFYRLRYEDIVGFELGDVEMNNVGTITKQKPFELYSGRNIHDIVEDYVSLLQPIVIANSQIIPAKYSFLAKKSISNEGIKQVFTIPLASGFTNGFRLFCNIHIYNNASLGISMGGTLPATTSSYFNQIAAINQQQNAGIASAVGNIVGRPLNWLSAGLSGNSTSQFTQSSSSTSAYNRTTKYNNKGGVKRKQPFPTLSETDTSGWNSEDTSGTMRNAGATIGGLGGFIGDFVNIHNTIEQTKIAKRNVGIGYLATTDDDMYNSLTTNAFMLNLEESYRYPLDQGLFTIGSRLIFDDETKHKYVYYYRNWGFPINTFVPNKYFSEIEKMLNINMPNNTLYFELDRNWCLTELDALAPINNNDVRNEIIDQLVSGIRMRYY